MKHPLHRGHSQGHLKRGGIIERGERGGLRRGSSETAPSVLRDITQGKIKSDRAEGIQHGEQCGRFSMSSGDKGNNKAR